MATATSLTSGEVMRKAKVTPSGMPPLTKPMNSGTAEHEQNGEPVLTTPMLSQMIRLYGDSMQGFMGNYLERAMHLFTEQQAQFRQQLGGMLGPTPWTMMNQMAERNMEMWKEMQQQFLRNASPASPAKTNEGAAPGKRTERK